MHLGQGDHQAASSVVHSHPTDPFTVAEWNSMLFSPTLKARNRQLPPIMGALFQLTLSTQTRRLSCHQPTQPTDLPLETRPADSAHRSGAWGAGITAVQTAARPASGGRCRTCPPRRWATGGCGRCPPCAARPSRRSRPRRPPWPGPPPGPPGCWPAPGRRSRQGTPPPGTAQPAIKGQPRSPP